jgi:hypothetical protein
VIRIWADLRTGRHGSLRRGLMRPVLMRLIQIALAIAVVCTPVIAQNKPATASNAGSYRIAGTVVNVTTGEPIQRAVVSALGQDDNHSIASVVSDAQGHFALEGLAAAKYPLSASKRGFRTALYDDHEGYNTAIVTGSDQDTTHLIFFLVPGAVLHGVVSGDGGDPVEGARVMLFEKPRHPTQGDRFLQLDSATTDDTGAYEFGNLADGDYFVAVAAQPWYAMAMHRAGGNSPGNGASDAAPNSMWHTRSPTSIRPRTKRPQRRFHWPREAARKPTSICTRFLRTALCRTTASRSAGQESIHPGNAAGRSIFGTPIPAEVMFTTDSAHPGVKELNGVAPGHYELALGNPPHIVELDATAERAGRSRTREARWLP